MKIRVISLKSSKQRREHIARQFADLDTDFEFFDAVTPSESLAHINCYDASEYIVNCGRAATSTEIACYASHLALWRQCVDDGEPYLVLEDDAELDDSFQTGLFVASSQIGRLGIIRVSLPDLSSSIVVDRLGPFHIHYCRRVPLLALGYAISPRAAAQLADCGSIVEEPVDKFLQRFWKHQRPVFAVTPPFVRLSSHANESDIGPRHRPPVTASSWLRRAARKAQNTIARTHFNALQA